MTERPSEQRHQDLEDPRAEAAEAVKRQREADSAASGPSGQGAPALGGASVTSGGTSVSDADEAARPAGAPTPPPGAQP